MRYRDKIFRAREYLEDSVEINPNVRGGKLVLKGTRFPVSRLLSEISEGKYSLREIANDYNLDFETVEKFIEALSFIYDTRPII